MQVVSTKLELNSDCVEFCPIQDKHHVFAVGNYQLEAETQKKHGKILIYEVQYTEDVPENYQKVHEVNTSAVFDLKWLDTCMDSEPVLGSVDTDGEFACYALKENNSLELISKTSVDPSLVFLDWQDSALSGGTEFRATTSDAQGYVRLFSLSKERGLTEQECWKAHDYEGWTAVFDKHSPEIIYSGADDCLFRGWDIRTKTPIFTNKLHGAGVCCIQDNKNIENRLATGSYDDHLYIWDKRSWKTPIDTVKMEAGVWRIKWHPNSEHASTILLGCMRAGFHVMKSTDDSLSKWSIGTSYLKHGDDLAYGCDWSHDHEHSSLIVSCSFYENLLDMWTCSDL